MTTKHTPSPWHWTASCPAGTMVTDDKGAQIALWPPQGGTAEQCATARLIAAAPDLLAALQDVVDAYQRHFDVMPVAWQTFDNIARDAIARATGADQ